MDTYIFLSVFSLMYSWIICTVLSAPVGEASPGSSSASPGAHVRTKRCSCASFLDKECVYFCHLDIIWVNTPERVVSYGMGNAPRAKRELSDTMATKGSEPRCQCARGSDRTCKSFCGPVRQQQPLRSEIVNRLLRPAARGEGCRGARCKHEPEADTGRSVNRLTKKSDAEKKQAWPRALRVALRTRLLLEKWTARRRHRARAWEGQSTAS